MSIVNENSGASGDRKSYKVIVAGGRDFTDLTLMTAIMDRLLVGFMGGFPVTGTTMARWFDEVTIVSGTARGADATGEDYADSRAVKVMRFPAEWDVYGKAAGYKRNQQMARYADALVAFWDGKSRGTKHMIDIARAEGLRVRVYRYDGEFVK